jgi:hypothetical protein
MLRQAIIEALDIFLPTGLVFDLSALLELLGGRADAGEVGRILESDHGFMRVAANNDQHVFYCNRRKLFCRMLYLNLRLARAKVGSLTQQQFMSFLALSGNWSTPPLEILAFGQELGLCCPAWTGGRFVFPLANIMQHVTPYTMRWVVGDLKKRYQEDGLSPVVITDVRELVSDELLQHPQGMVNVVVSRQGLLDGEVLTLQEMGEKLGLTRERVRQIEAKFWSRVDSPAGHSFKNAYVASLLSLVMTKRGSCVFDLEPTDAAALQFAAKRAGVPISKIGDPPRCIVGVSIPENFLKSREMEPSRVGQTIEAHVAHLLNSNDVDDLARTIAEYNRERSRLVDRVALALRSIGEPAHYSRIADAYESMFADRPCTERMVHATLLRQQRGIVWVGTRGIYALEEWGYTRPSIRLYELVERVVREKYESMNRPVPTSIIVAEVSKVRPLLKHSSVNMAIGLNPNLVYVGSSGYVPIAPGDEGAEALDEKELDRILHEFDPIDLE